MEEKYLVKTHIFEGPLDTLLSLIEKRKLFINDISLAQVADDYIAYVKSLENFSLNSAFGGVGRPAEAGLAIADLTHFILIASTLVLIKSKSLLPQLSLTEDEEHSIEDLEARLTEYQKYKTLAIHLKNRFGIYTEYLRQPSIERVIVFTPDKNATVLNMLETIRLVIKQIPKEEFVSKAVVNKIISLEEMIENLTKRITTSLKMSFKDFAKVGKAQKIEVIISFLAMLELVKQGIIAVRQDKDFYDIEMETQVTGIPKY